MITITLPAAQVQPVMENIQPVPAKANSRGTPLTELVKIKALEVMRLQFVSHTMPAESYCSTVKQATEQIGQAAATKFLRPGV